jgi:hypothetical protein
MNYYYAKFIREGKDVPSDWIIVPEGRGFNLIYVGGKNG